MTTLRDVTTTLAERKYLRGLAHADLTRPVVVIGSYARRTRSSPSSDIDLLVLDTSTEAPRLPNVQVVTIAPDDFRRRAATGDEFALWALRYGVPLSGGREWSDLRTEMLASAPWPRSRPSHERAFKRLRAAEALLSMGDLPAAEEETLFALSHVARAELLDADVFPLSRPELPDQLASVGKEELAAALRRSIRGGLTSDEIRGFIELVRTSTRGALSTIAGESPAATSG